MYTALRATTKTLATLIKTELETDKTLATFFGNGTMTVSSCTPTEMATLKKEGVSLWLYRAIRDDAFVNAPPIRRDFNALERPPLPLRLHYLVTPLVNGSEDGAETEQVILGKVLQTFHDRPCLRGTDLQDDFQGSDVELTVRLEALNLEEITRVWDALEGSYQLSVSYEVSVVRISSALGPERVAPVYVALAEHGTIVGSGG